MLPLDLHVLSLPPAFNLSHDQSALIEADVMIGAGSLVPPGKKLESGFLYVGSPVKQARPLTEEERAFLLKSASNYVQNKEDYLHKVKDINLQS